MNPQEIVEARQMFVVNYTPNVGSGRSIGKTHKT